VPTRGDLREPRSYLDEGGWPAGRLVADAPDVVKYALVISRRLAAALPPRHQSAIAADTQMARSTLNDLLSGRRIPDLVSIVKLEGRLRTRLWPTRREVARLD
jgi:hypothetical protein